MSNWEITPAGDDDLAAIVALLQDCDLPCADLVPAHLPEFRVCRDGGRLIATGGLELCGEAVLLRSVAVLPECREHGLANHLLETLERHAVACSHKDMYLLTTSASGFFARRGFRPLAREDAPSAVAASAEFRSLCPDAAVFMHKTLTDHIVP